MGDLSTADVLAMTRNDNAGGFLEGNGIIILLLFLLFLGGGFGGFGNNNNANTQGTFTRAEMQDGFNNQNLVNSFNSLNSGLTNSFANLNLNMNNGFNGIAMGMNNGFNGVNSNLANLGYQMQQCCCQTKEQIQVQGDLTRQAIQGVTNLINENSMQNLRDVINDKNRQISEASFDASQATQTAQLEAFILANKSTT